MPYQNQINDSMFTYHWANYEITNMLGLGELPQFELAESQGGRFLLWFSVPMLEETAIQITEASKKWRAHPWFLYEWFTARSTMFAVIFENPDAEKIYREWWREKVAPDPKVFINTRIAKPFFEKVTFYEEGEIRNGITVQEEGDEK